MTCYVDDQSIPYGRLRMCHMLADSDDELHAMADRIGVSRSHHQYPPLVSGSHYDICRTKRHLAVAAGAVEITRRQAAAMNARRKATGELGSPHDALRWFAQQREGRQP